MKRKVIITGNGYNSKEEAEDAICNVISEDVELYLQTNTKAWVHFFKLDKELVIELVRHTVTFCMVAVEEPLVLLKTLSENGRIESDHLDIGYIENGILITFK